MAIPMLIMAGVAAASAISGGIKASKAKKEAAKLAANRPELSDSPFLRDNIRLAQSELANGMSAGAEKAYTQGMDRNLSSSIGAVLQGGGSLNNIANIFDSSAQGQQRMALMQDNLRLNQIQNLTAAGGASETQRQQQFQFNEFAPWADNAQAASAARAQGNQQMWNGITSLGSTVAGGIAAQQGQKQLNDALRSSGGRMTPQTYQNAQSNIESNNRYIQQGAQMLVQPTYAQPKVTAPAFISPNYANGMLR
jgi:hypothetical protein